MEVINKPGGCWTKDRCRKDALQYKTKMEFRKGSNGALQVAYKNRWLDEIFTHMPKVAQRPRKTKSSKDHIN